MKLNLFDIVELDIEEFDEQMFHFHDYYYLLLLIKHEISMNLEYNIQVQMI
jgi:hypothetical protein